MTDNKKVETNKVKNLTIAELKKLNKKLDTKQEVTLFINIPDENENNTDEKSEVAYKFTYDTHFRKSVEHKVLDDMIELFNVMGTNEDAVEMATPYTALLIIKHFTNIHVPDDIDEAMETLKILIDLNILNKIINSLPEDQIVKIYDSITKAIQNTTENLEENKEEAKKLSDNLENQEVKDLISEDDSKMKEDVE